VNCFLIDEGTLLTVRPEDLIADVPDIFQDFEPQAKKCRLRNAEPVGSRSGNNSGDSGEDDEDDAWCWEAIDFFRGVCRQGDLVVKSMQRVVPNSIHASYYDYEYVIEVSSRLVINLIFI
jgi:hypothetical protein